MGIYALLVTLSAAAGPTSAPLLEAPIGGRPISVPGGVVCPPLAEWSLSSDGRIAPPATSAAVGRKTTVNVAPTPEHCSDQAWQENLVATAPWPSLDPAGTVAWVDEGRLEVRGSNLKGLTIHWRWGSRDGVDVCTDPRPDGSAERCELAIAKGLPADPSALQLSWTPGGAVEGAGAIFFDAGGERASPEAFRLRVSRMVIKSPLAEANGLDLLDGAGRIALGHPESVAAVECSPFRCDVSDGAISVYPGASLASAVTIRARLAPKVFASKGDNLESTISASVPLMRCSMAFASGEPLRGVDGSRVVMRIGSPCARDVGRLRWFANGNAAEVTRIEKDRDDAFVVLRVGRVESERLTITIARDELDRALVASATSDTKVLPLPVATLEIAGKGMIDFIPKNRPALVHVVAGEANLVLLPIAAVYAVSTSASGTEVRGEPLAVGLISLRFGYRAKGLPAGLDQVDLATIQEPVSRPLREASVPVDFSEKAKRSSPLVELLCQSGAAPTAIEQGKPTQIPFAARDSCRLVIHRERLKPEDGPQSISVETEVSGPDGESRGGRSSEHMTLRPGSSPQTTWLHGIKHPFDRLSVRVSHRADESLYLNDSGTHHQDTEAQWAVIAGSGRLRFYATATIPTGLYRVNAPNSILSLNFGVLSRLVPLTREGRESLLGVELGAMGVNLAGVSNYPPTLAVVAGLGVSLPLGSRGEVTQSSVSVHAWLMREFRNDACTSSALAPGASGCQLASRWAFVFGPSISIGDLGANL